MTKKIIKSSDVLGDNYYIYELSSSNYTPALNGTITITCTVTDVYGDPIGSKSITLYKNGTSVSTKTTNSSGVATWSVTCSTAGIQSFKVGNKAIEIFVDNKSDTGHTHTTTDITNLSIPSASNTTPSADTANGSVGTGTTWARSNHTHPKSSLYAESSHTHGNLQNNGQVGSTAQANKNVVTNSSGLITTEDKPTIPSKTSQLTNDSGFLTSHQSLDSKTVTVEKLATAESGYLSSYVVKQNGVQVGNTINIPKDFLVKSGSVKTVSTANNPISGYKVGDKYIDLVINVQEGTSTDSHIYILVSDLIDTPVAISDVTGLQTALNGKANATHTHSPSQVGSGISSNDWLLTYMQGDGSTQEYFNQSVNHEIGSIWDEFNQVYNNTELVSLKTDDISQLTSNTEYYPSAKGVADYIDYIIPVTNLSDFNDDLNYAPTAHATSATTYGVSSASDYGHAMASSTSPKANGTAAVGSETAKFARGDHVHPHSCVNDLTSTSTTTPLAANQGKVLNEKKLEKTTDTSLGTDIYETISSDTMCQDGWIIENGLQSTFAYITTTNTTVTMNNAEVEMRYQNNGKRSVKLQYTVSRTGQSDYTANEIISPGEKSNARFITYSEPSGGGDGIDDTVDWSAIYYYDVISITYTVSVTYRKINSVADIVYPIGSIYTSTNDIPPIALFGGRWEQLKDRFLLGSGDTYTNGTTGGSATVSLTQSQMPRHNHTTNAHTHNVSESGEYFVTSEANGANNTRVSYNASGNRYVDGMNDNKTPFHHRTTTGSASPTTKYTGGSGTSESASNGSAHENMPPYLTVYMWKRIA